MLDSSLIYIVAGSAVLLLGISKGGLGGAFNIIAMPMLALAIDPRYAAALILPILCLFDLMALWTYRGRGNGHLVKIMLLGALLGIGVGTISFKYLDANGIRLMLGIIALLFGIRSLSAYLKDASPPTTTPPDWVGTGSGALAGFTSFVAHAGAPPVQMYLLPMRMHKTLLHSTMVLFFAAINYIKLVPYFWLGQLNMGSLAESMSLLPFAPLGFFLGVWLHKRISDRHFYLVSYIALLLMGGKLVYDGFTGLLF